MQRETDRDKEKEQQIESDRAESIEKSESRAKDIVSESDGNREKDRKIKKATDGIVRQIVRKKGTATEMKRCSNRIL